VEASIAPVPVEEELLRVRKEIQVAVKSVIARDWPY
jgi:hypothetical protein